MRKKMITLVLAVALLMSVCVVPAFADGFYDILPDSGVTVAPQNASGAAVTEKVDYDEVKEVYDGSVRLGVTLTGATVGQQYLVVLAAADDVTGITKDTLLYVDQVQAESDTVEFSVYPILKEGDLTLFVIDGDGTTKKASLGYFIDKPAYTLGDVDGDGWIDSWDASLVMQYEVGLIDDARIAADGLNFDAGDVSEDGWVDSWDASQIMQYEVGLITEFIKD